MNINETIAPNSDQLNAEDMLAGPITVTITGVEKGTPDQPVNILLEEFPGRAYRPCKTMRRVLIAAWGSDASAYVGRRITLFNDQTVQWGGKAVGGVRISHLSDIAHKLTLSLTTTRGKRSPFVVDPLPDAPAAISDDQVTEFEDLIAQAKDSVELDIIARNLKSHNLGKHRDHLLSAWKDRHSTIEGNQP